MRRHPLLVTSFILLVTTVFAAGANAATFRDIDAVGERVRNSGTVEGVFNLIGERGEADSITIGKPYYETPRIVKDALGFPAGTGVEVERAVVKFYVRNGDVGEEVEMELELFGREIGDVEFERDFTIFKKKLNARLRGVISETGMVKWSLEIDGRALVDYASLEIRADVTSAMPEPGAAMVYLVGLAVLSRKLRHRRTV